MKYDFDLNVEKDNSLSLMLRNMKSDADVLEFGPANGRMTKYMKEILRNRVYLVELEEAAGREALQYGVDLVVGDIENYEWLSKYGELKFDHIVFADVLEHLRNPLEALKKAKTLLKQDGTILISVPNLGHNSVLIDLLNNKFQYNSTGLLDDTHIHFFTKTSLEKMIQEVAMYPIKKMATYAPVGSIEIENAITDVEGIAPKYWKQRAYGDVYQFVYVIGQTSIERIEEPEMTLPYYYAQVFYDKEECWKEEKSIRYIHRLTEDVTKISMKLDASYDNIRMDPINEKGIVKIEEAYGLVNGVPIKLDIKYHNAVCKQDELFFFENEDPTILYDLPEGTTEVVFAIRHKRLGEGAEEVNLLGIALRMLADSEEKRKSERATLQHQINLRDIELNQLQTEKSLFEQTKLYKLYKYLYKK